MQNTAQKFRQSPIIFEKPGILPENFNELQLPYSSIFFTETLNTFPTYQCLKKGVWKFLKFCLDLELFAKIKKDLVSAHVFFTLTNNSKSKQNKNPTHPFIDITE